MTENEQIQEMALAICKSRGVADVDDCEKCWQCDNGCLYQEIANGLYNKDYRKASEVAKEIFAEIKEVLETLGFCSPELVNDNLMKFGYRKVERGEWVKTSEYMPIYGCSLCNERNLFRDGNNVFSNFCPHCGADMRGEGK